MLRNVSVALVTVLAVAAMGCGGGAQVRVYKGTATTTVSQMGGTNVVTETNKVFTVLPGDLPNEWIFIDTNTAYAATASGENITFNSNQGYSTTESVGTVM